MKNIILSIIALCVLQSAQAQTITSAVPGYISYQGRALDATGAVVGAGTPVNRTVTFRVWDHATNVLATDLLYSEQQTVTISDGEFSVLIGQGVATVGSTFGYTEAGKGLPTVKISDVGVFGGASRYLGVTIDDGTAAVDNEITPRQQIVSSAFAIRAKFAEQLGSNGNTALTALDTGNIGIGNTNPPALFTITGANTSTSTSTPQLLITADDITERLRLGVDSTGTGTGFIQAFKEGTGAQNLLLNPNGGNVGIGTGATPPVAPLSFGATLGEKISLYPGIGTTCSGLGVQAGQLQIHTENSSNAITFGTGSSANMTELMRIAGGGNVGIGTVSPLGKLHLYEATGSVAGINSGSLILEHGNAGGASSITFRSCGNITSDYASIQYQDASTLGGAGEASKLIISAQNDSNDDICLMPSGNVGIGTTAPQFKLDVYSGDAAGIRLGPNDNFSNSLLLGGWNAQDHTVARIQSSNGTLLLDSMNGFGIRLNTLANGDVILATGGGRVGIGTVAPAAPLHVAGYAPVAGYLEWVTQANDSYNAGHWWWTEPVSILSENVVRAGALHIFSDARIKDIKKVSDGGADLATLMKIEVTDYGYKDVVARGNRPQKKVVAQQVEKIYPQAVSRSTDVVPDVFKKATVKDGWVELASDLKVGERVKLMSEKDQSVHEVLELRKGGFRTDWKEDTENLFVYGREVKDFRSVDYDAIAMLNVSATQQLAKQLKEKDAKIAALDASNAALVTSNAALDAKVAALGAKFAALEKLLSKAR